AFISNPSYWTTDPLEVQITSNTSVIFTYSVTSLFHWYINSSWTTDLSKDGVQYSISAGQSSDLSIFTYMATSTEFDNATVDLLYPKDWENVTVLDPLSTDITNNCSISPGRIHIPNSEMDRSGWWEINLQSPNYAQNVSIQIQDGSTGQWSENSLFKPGNTTRVQVEIGTVTGNPTDGSPVNITWILPNSTQWAYDSITTMENGIVNSSNWILGGANTSAGQWEVTALWSNGTEIAYDYTVFDMYHTASLTPRETLVETDTGLLITNMLYYVDDDTSDFILDASALMVANWSGMIINFIANPIYNWWQADFNTSLVGAGQFVVVVNASRPYYDDVTCQFTIVSTLRTNFQLTSVGPLPTEVGLYEEFSVQMHYELESSVGVDGSTIQMNYTGPQGGLHLLGQSNTGPGDYSINITSSKSGTYTVIITASKAFHYSNSDSFTLIVGEVGTTLVPVNGTSDIGQLEVPYRLVVQYRNSTGYGLIGANVSVIDINPSTGLVAGLSNDEGNGYYSIVLTSSITQTYTIFINANMTDHVTQIASFTITVNEIPTVLTADSAGTTLSVGDSQSVELSFRDESAVGIPGATIDVVNPPSELSFNISEISGGLYSVNITALTPGTYQIAFKASMVNYLNSTLGYTVIVRGFGSNLIRLNGTADFAYFGDSYRLVVQFTNSTGFGLSWANVTVMDVVPAAGLGIGATINEGSGFYSIDITAASAGIFTILLRANLTDYDTQFASFGLTVREIPTILTLDDSGATIAVDQSHIVQITFRDDTLIGLTSATILVLNPPSGLAHVVAEVSSGQYTLTLTPSVIGTYEFAIRATLPNYLNSTVGFTLIVRTIPTLT
ncbi:MAG: hypothetical protein ACW974_01340, partial [Candidatus Thorarchaeota archaeon]